MGFGNLLCLRNMTQYYHYHVLDWYDVGRMSSQEPNKSCIGVAGAIPYAMLIIACRAQLCRYIEVKV